MSTLRPSLAAATLVAWLLAPLPSNATAPDPPSGVIAETIPTSMAGAPSSMAGAGNARLPFAHAPRGTDRAANDNGGFENSPVGVVTDLTGGVADWSLDANPSLPNAPEFAIVDDVVFEGDRALRVTVVDAGANPWNVQAIAENIPAVPGDEYAFVVWARAAADGATANFTVGNASFQEYGRIGNAKVALTTEWQPFWFTFEVDDQETVIRAPLHFSFEANEGNAIYIDALSVIPLETSRVQVIHNAPDPDAASVDVYVNGERLLDDLGFQEASAFIDLTSGVPTTVDVVPASDADNSAPVYSVRLDTGLPANGTVHLIASGVLDDTPDNDADDTPDEFQLLVAAGARESGANAPDVDLRVVHGSPDAPPVDITSGATVLVDGASYLDVAGYLPLAPDTYTLAVSAADGSATVGAFTVDLSGSAGAAVTLLASGFLDPSDDGPGAPAFGLLAVFADGTTAPIAVPAAGGPEAELSLSVANPVSGTATVRFSLAAPGDATVALYDALGRRVATLTDGEVGLGEQTAPLDAAALASGVYVLRLEAESGALTQTITVVR